MQHTIEVQNRIEGYVRRAIDAMMDEGYEIISSTKSDVYSIVEAWVLRNPTSAFDTEEFLKVYKKKHPGDLNRAVFVPKMTAEEKEAFHEQQRIKYEEEKKAHRIAMAERRKAKKEAEAARVAAMTPRDRVLYRLEQERLAKEQEKIKAEKLAKKNA